MTAMPLANIDLAASTTSYSDAFPAIQVLDADGNVVDQESMKTITDELLVDLMRDLVWAQKFDERMVLLNRQGTLGNYAPAGGQEASQFATLKALEKGDFLVPTYRDLAPLIKHGVPMHKAFLWWKGHMAGNQIDREINAWMPQVIVGGHVPHAAGVALAKKLNDEKNIVMLYLGDGATSQGDFYEGINFAGVYKAPMVTIIQNNLYAISVPISKQTAAVTLAQKAVAAGIPALRVDGNDPVALYIATKMARDYAIAGNGPVVIESLTYRTGNHTMSDDAKRYRSDEEVAEWAEKSGLRRLRAYLESKNLWTAEDEKAIEEELKATMKTELALMAKTPAMKVTELLEHMYEVAPQNIKEQIEFYAAKEAN
ncbi:MAG: pyruvate dehydrogenase (acetyl-transferring) E1 component subunit alpha [Propionibacteriaceae bacterium]